MAKSHVGLIGAGVTGLQTAIFLLDAGYDVTIVAKHLPGDLDIDYASPWAGAHWRTHAAPHETELCAWDVETYEYWRRIVEKEERGGEGLEKSGLKVRRAKLRRAEPNRHYDSVRVGRNNSKLIVHSTHPAVYLALLLVRVPHPSTAVRTPPLSSASTSSPRSPLTPPPFRNRRDAPTEEIASGATSLWWRHAVLDFAVIPPHALPIGAHYGVVFTSFYINVPAYLSYLLRNVTAKGGKVVRRELPATRGFGAALRAAEECVGGKRVDVFVNATGLGARGLVGDQGMFPTRGQTVLVRGEAAAARTRVGSGYIAYCIPRPGSGMTVLGGTKEVGVWNKEVDKGTTEAILGRARVLAPELMNADGEFDVVSEQVGFRPSREGGPRVEMELIDGKRVVHSYGHSGAGYQNSVGCARKVLQLVEISQSSLNQTAKL